MTITNLSAVPEAAPSIQVGAICHCPCGRSNDTGIVKTCECGRRVYGISGFTTPTRFKGGR